MDKEILALHFRNKAYPLLLLIILCFHHSTVHCQEWMIEHISTTEPPSPSSAPGVNNGFGRIILSMFFGFLTGLIGALLVAFFLRCFILFMNRTPILKGPVIFSPKIASNTLQLALANENHLLGSSPNGKYYRTVLDNGLTISVKRLEPFENGSPETQSKSVKRRIQQELEMLAGLRHRNLMSLRAFIREPNRFSLVYDYVPNGSLEDAMNGVRENQLQLSWEVRLRIAVGISKGLQYLHFECIPQNFHYNLKPTNVMLDAEFEPRLADCGLAKLIPNSDRAAAGYSSPECFQNCSRYTDKNDVFSFGMILAVLLTARDPTDPFFGESSNGGSLGRWLWHLQQAGEAREALDKKILGDEVEEDEMLMAVRIAVVCYQICHRTGLPVMSLFLCSPNCTVFELRTCLFEAIYQFGDSISDTGNLIREGPVGASSVSARPPYGETYFHRPTGRFCNGRLMIDYFAMAFQLPFLNPYLEKNAEFDHGLNFAVAGGTALDDSFFEARNISLPSTNSPLSVQLNWFRTHLKSICNTPADCATKLKGALIMMGEVGGNDYNYAFSQGKSIDEIRTYVPYVVGAITKAIRAVIRLGAIQIVVPGNFPIGCFPVYLTLFRSSDPKAYDDMGCLTYLNEFAMYHNNYLQGAMALLRHEYPQAVLLYADYYTAFLSVLRRAPYLGFDQQSTLKACCGTGGAYNYDRNRTCGHPVVPVCPNPAEYISWDGVHLTQQTYHYMSEFLITDICPQSATLLTKLHNKNINSHIEF